jgi:mannose-6-phosphate isomerase-like protein (cupin superfamily)
MGADADSSRALVIEIESLRRPGGGSPLFEGYRHGGVATSCFVLDTPPGRGSVLHRHPYSEIFVLLDGQARVWVDGVTADVHAGQIAIVPAEAAHRYTNTGTVTLRTVNVHPHERRIQDDLPAEAEPAAGTTSRTPVLLESEALRPPAGGVPFFEGADHGDVPATFFVVDTPPAQGPRLHSHPYAEVFVLRDGRARFWVGDEVLDARAGQIVVAPAEVPHRFVSTGPGALRAVNIQPVARMIVDWLEDDGR